MEASKAGGLAAELRSCVDAHYPLLVLQTHEEDRAFVLLEAVARVVGIDLVTVDPMDDPAAQLESIAGSEERCLVAAPDLHPWLREDGALVRQLRELLVLFEERGQTLVLVGHHVEVPPELSMDAVVFDLPLPSAAYLAQLLHEQCQAAGVTIARETGVRAIRSVQGLTAAAAKRAFRRSLASETGLGAGLTDGLVDEKRRILQRTDLLEFIEAPPSIDVVGGLDDLKEWLVERELAFDQRARDFGLPTPKGLLLVGVQGCGKSLTAKAVAQMWQLPLTRLDFGALFTASRSPEQNLRRVFRLAEALAPMVLWVDEIDKVFQTVGRKSGGGSEQLMRVFSAFITWMQEKQSPVFVVATANGVEHLPGELLRKGRFDEIFFVDLPSLDERKRILDIHMRGHGRDPAGFDLDQLASKCEHFSGAELEQLVIAALYRAFPKRRELLDEDLDLAAKAIVPLYRTAEEQIKGLREWAKTRARRASPDARLAEIWVTSGR